MLTLFDGLDGVDDYKVLNLFAGIGGNRELWQDCHVTAVEYDFAIAEVYGNRFPDDNVIVGDALDYVEKHYSEYDFIWASPPCPSHGQYRHNVGVLGKGYQPIVPDMKSLYGLIVFLQTYFAGAWVVENVEPYYDCPIRSTFTFERHLFWANFHPGHRDFKSDVSIKNDNSINDFEIMDLGSIKDKRQVLRNCVDPHIGLHVFEGGRS